MDALEESPTPPRKESRRGKGFVVAIFGTGLLAGIIVAGLNIAGAQTDATDAVVHEVGPGAPLHGFVEEAEIEGAPVPAPEGGRKMGPHGPKKFHRGMGGGPVLHGEFVVKKDDKFQTMVTQKGKVTEVSNSSITVKSEDDFSRTYVVNDDTRVNADKTGIGDVKKDDDVRIMGILDGKTARAVHIMDVSKMKELHEKWRAEKHAPDTAL